MTVKSWLKQAKLKLADKGITSAVIDAELVLCNIQNCQRDWLITHDTTQLASEVKHRADLDLRRRLNHEPMTYILGHKDFYGLDLRVDKRALIPRGESEVLVEAALKIIQNADLGSQNHSPKLKIGNSEIENLVVVEVGTGSGAIICAIAQNAPGHRYIATEVSPEALELAKANAVGLNLNIDFRLGSLCEPLQNSEGKIDLLVANLPYISEDLLTVLDPTVHYFEPHLALSGGSDGLDLYRQFIPQTKGLLAKGGCMIVEHEFDQGEAMRELILKTYPDTRVETKPDFSGHDRMTLVYLK